MKSNLRLLPRWMHVPLGVLSGLLAYAVVASFMPSEPSLAIDAGSPFELDAYFASKYEAASRIEWARALDECRKMLDERQDKVVEALLTSGSYEIVSVDPVSRQLEVAPDLTEHVSAVVVSSIDAGPGMFQKVSIPRGFDPEYDLLIEECVWLEDATGLGSEAHTAHR